MTAFTIVASKDSETVTTVRLGPKISLEKARGLVENGWQVHITDSEGRQYTPDQFHQVLQLD
jgi:hypothetical protein